MSKKVFVYGEIIIPVYFPVYDTSKEQALQYVESALNSKTIELIDGDIQTCSGKSYPLIAQRCRVKWIDTVTDDQIG